MSWKTSIKKHEFLISAIGLVIGVILLIIGLFGVFFADTAPTVLADLIERIGDWKYWALVGGAFMTLIFSLVIFFRYRNLQEFKELYETESKSKFRKNIARIETLALKLGPEYEEKVIEKEEELNIRR